MTTPARPARRRSFGRVLAEMHYTLRTEGDTPGRRAAAVALGTFLGCLPVYGAHLLLCALFARLLRVNRITTYLAAHVNNPLTAPLLLYVELVAGHLALSGRLPPATLAHLRDSSLGSIGLELVVGCLAVGAILGVLAGVVTWAIARRRPRLRLETVLRDEASRPYTETGIFHWEFVRGKLRHDPLYMDLLREGVLPRTGTLLDLGCGRGILPALLAAAERTWRAGHWSGGGAGWPQPPLDLELIGIERRARHAAVARRALGGRARVIVGDLTQVALPPADSVVLADVLHYLPADGQAALIARVARVLRPGGQLIVRECDAAGGLRFVLTQVQERACALARGAWRQRFCYRTAVEWRALLEAEGLTTGSRSMGRGTPFANVLIDARKPAVEARPRGETREDRERSGTPH